MVNNRDMQDIYLREDLLELYKSPINKGTLSNPTVSVDEKNPMCGDEITLDLSIEDDIITGLKYRGDACAVSLISSSLVSEEIVGKTLDEVKNFSKQDVLDLIGIKLTTSRVKCALLILEALNKAIEQYEINNRTSTN